MSGPRYLIFGDGHLLTQALFTHRWFKESEGKKRFINLYMPELKRVDVSWPTEGVASIYDTMERIKIINLKDRGYSVINDKAIHHQLIGKTGVEIAFFLLEEHHALIVDRVHLMDKRVKMELRQTEKRKDFEVINPLFAIIL